MRLSQTGKLNNIRNAVGVAKVIVVAEVVPQP
jgi:hypothetical protein